MDATATLGGCQCNASAHYFCLKQGIPSRAKLHADMDAHQRMPSELIQHQPGSVCSAR